MLWKISSRTDETRDAEKTSTADKRFTSGCSNQNKSGCGKWKTSGCSWIMSSSFHRQVLQDSKVLFRFMVSSELVNDQNPPVLRQEGTQRFSVGYANSANVARMLKDISYPDMYDQIRAQRTYNFRMLDGALIQMNYTFADKSLLSHRLAFLPAPNMLQYDDNSEIYDRDDRFGHIVGKNQIAVPVRFDYDARHSVAENLTHPISHLTLGQYQFCRIPVTAGVAPRVFIEFILTSFYKVRHTSLNRDLPKSSLRFPVSIKESELRVLHIGIPA